MSRRPEYATQTAPYRAERRMMENAIRPGMRVLDLGCGTGRITKELAALPVDLTACDNMFSPLTTVRTRVPCTVSILQSDARALPFGNSTFDVVIFAFNGLDYIDEHGRLQAVREVERVLVPGGIFIFSTHNPIGMILTPRGIRRIAHWRWRYRYLRTRSFRSRFFLNDQGLLLYHAVPARVIREVECTTGLHLRSVMSRSGLQVGRLALTAFSQWPYYLFTKSDVCNEQQISGVTVSSDLVATERR